MLKDVVDMIIYHAGLHLTTFFFHNLRQQFDIDTRHPRSGLHRTCRDRFFELGCGVHIELLAALKIPMKGPRSFGQHNSSNGIVFSSAQMC